MTELDVTVMMVVLFACHDHFYTINSVELKELFCNRTIMLRAVIFDFNGVLVDDEPIHFELFKRVLGEQGITLTKRDYYGRYLGMDDRGCFTAAFRDHGREVSDAQVASLIERKAVYYLEAIGNNMKVFPGVASLVPEVARQHALAIASGALRNEIELVLSAIQLRDYFTAIVSAEDVTRGKPEPEIFLKALSKLNAKLNGQSIAPPECLVIEDSKEGIRGARKAGMKCLAVTNSHPAEALREADAVVETLEKVDVRFLQRLLH